jgi:phosphatidylserine/phosphatidylglycerophosphate/cardiolipin synthase-like enzyme
VYDPKVSDPGMLRLLAERMHAGVDVRIIGKLGGKCSPLISERYPGRRLHVRAMIRDGNRAFLGSQSLRRLELESRREVGVIVTDSSMVKQMRDVFEEDWALTESGKRAARAIELAATSESEVPVEAAAR